MQESKVNKLNEIRKAIDEVDWDFSDRSNRRDIHYIHPYPAKFIADIPRELINILGIKKGTAILDPFCGSGTTLVEANKKGIPVVGVDLNPIACLVSRVKTSRISTGFVKCAEQCVEQAKIKKICEVMEIKNVDHWFKQDVQEGIQSLIEEIDSLDNDNEKEALKVCLSSIIVRVSNQDSDTRYAAVKKNVSKDDVYKLFLEACNNLAKIKETQLINDSDVKIINKNVLNITKEDIGKEIGLVITSPPYPNAYEYWLYHKYRMWWLGYDAEAVKKEEIGARAHYYKKNSQTPEDFKMQMDILFNTLNEVVVKGGYICVVIGRSIIHGEVIDNASMIEEIADKYKMTMVSNITREIASSRKSFNLAHAKIKKESLLIFQKN